MSKYCRQVNVLLLKIKGGDKTKINDIFELTFNHLKFVALHYLYNKRDFEDALSETYYRALKYIQSFNVLKDGYNWLCRIVQNVAYDMNSKYGHYVLGSNTFVDDFSYSDEVDRMLNKDALYQHIKTFPQLDRQLIYYRFYMELSYGEIAKKLNRAKSFVHNRINILSNKMLKNFEI